MKKNALKLGVLLLGSTLLGTAYKAIDKVETKITDAIDEKFDNTADTTVAE